jgi:hypothetical protein
MPQPARRLRAGVVVDGGVDVVEADAAALGAAGLAAQDFVAAPPSGMQLTEDLRGDLLWPQSSSVVWSLASGFHGAGCTTGGQLSRKCP